MHVRRRFGPLGGLALLVGVLIAGCSQVPVGQPSGPSLGILSRAQISFSSLSFTALSNPGTTPYVPTAKAVAKGLGNDTWTSALSANWNLVLMCTNNGNNVPQGAVNYPGLNSLAQQLITPDQIDKNGTAPIDLRSQNFSYWDTWVSTNVDPASVCPNANYTVSLLGFQWNTITISLYSGDTATGTPADSVTFVCSDPGDPTTCAIPNGKKNS